MADFRADIKGIDKFIFEGGLDDNKLHLHISQVDPDTRAHPPHTHDGQEIFYVFEGNSEVVWFEGNWQEYERDRKRRLGVDADQPHRIKYRPLAS